MNDKFELFLEKIKIPVDLKSSVLDGYKLLFESLTSTASATAHNILIRDSSTGSVHVGKDPSGYNGGHNVVNLDELDDANEGEDRKFHFKLPGLIGEKEHDVQDIKNKFRSFLNKMHGANSPLTESIMKVIDILY